MSVSKKGLAYSRLKNDTLLLLLSRQTHTTPPQNFKHNA